MKLKWHKNLDENKWGKFPLSHQVLMIANEINRARNSLKLGDQKETNLCLERALELIFLSIANLKKKSQRKEFLRLKEVLAKEYVDNSKEIKSLDNLFKITLSLNSFAFNTEF